MAVVFDPDCHAWFEALDERVQDAVLRSLLVLQAKGPMLGQPYVDSIKGSRIANLKELRIQVGGDPWRILFAFDEARRAILLVGGNKAGDDRWYETNIPIAERRAKHHGF